MRIICSLGQQLFSLNPKLDVISGKRYDEKVDIFSFGIVLCEVRTCWLSDHNNKIWQNYFAILLPKKLKSKIKTLCCVLHVISLTVKFCVSVCWRIDTYPPLLSYDPDHWKSLCRPRVPPQDDGLWPECWKVCGEVPSWRLSSSVLSTDCGLLWPHAWQPVSTCCFCETCDLLLSWKVEFSKRYRLIQYWFSIDSQA